MLADLLHTLVENLIELIVGDKLQEGGRVGGWEGRRGEREQGWWYIHALLAAG